MTEISEELLRYKLPTEFRPGTDIISKLMLQDQSILNLVAEAIVGAPNNTYVATATSFSDGGNCDVLYTPSSHFSSKCPPIVIEVQQIVNEDFMIRAVRYCLNVYQQFKEYPVLLIFCVKNVASKTLASKFITHPQFPYCLQTPSDHFAKNVILVTYDSIKEELRKDKLLPIPALANFFTSGERSILANCTMNDPITIQLYQTAMKIVGDSGKHENSSESKLSALRSICGTLEEQFMKVAKFIPIDSNRAAQYAENGQIYCARLKRKYDDMAVNDSVTPLKDPESVEATQLDRSPSKNAKVSAEDWEWVEKYMKENVGRMNWSMCYDNGRARGYFTKYTNWNSLKVNYHKKN